MERVHHAEIERNPGRIEERQHAGTAEEVPQDRDVLQGLAALSLALQDSVHHAREGRGGQLLLYPARNPDERSAPHGVEHGEKQDCAARDDGQRSEEHTSELQSLMRTSYAVFCLKRQNNTREHLE